ncbi:serine hydrolase domain-containing protein [Rhodanobacter sp. Col0626]|uniref:serine hydrolase domain-containing protein n=1 Tax=Rhodanobacter sp. Col0626 TaxID=3415679 RepID=UPI003CFA0AED
MNLPNTARFRRLCGIALVTVLIAPPIISASALRTTPESPIPAIEHGLRPAVVLQGQPVSTKTLAAEMARLHVPGVSVAVIHGGGIAWAKGYGVARAGGAAVDPTTLFQAGSISKPVAAVGALQLVDDGQLSLDGNINDRLKSWKVPASRYTGSAGVTLRELLSHTAGVNVHGFPGYAAGKPVPTLMQVLDGRPPATNDPIRVVAEPGAKWSYSGGGYTIVQQLIDDVTKQAFPSWMRTHVLQPAGMARSSFAQPLPEKGLEDAAMPHDVQGQPVPGGPHVYPEMAAAGLWSTPTDLARFLIAVQQSVAGKHEGWLRADTARHMLQPVKPGHSIGFDIGGSGVDAHFSKSGDTEGFAAFMVAYPARGEGAVVMTNGASGSVLASELMRSIAATYGWTDFDSRVRASVPLEASAFDHFIGTYAFRDQQFVVRAANGHLTIASPGETPERLYAASPQELFVLSQDVGFGFDGAPARPCRSGHLQLGGQQVPFHRVE